MVFVSGIFLVVRKDVMIKYNVMKNELKIEKFYSDLVVDEENVDVDRDYIGILWIDSIGLYQGFYDVSSKYNNIDYGITVHEVSNYPNVVNGNLILMAHSGNSSSSYFKNLNKLNIGDFAKIIYGNDVYIYKLVNIYELDKSGKAYIDRNNSIKTLTLITCSKVALNKQVIYIFEYDK